jgi:TfoX/Sxy family transcriptional regulator of competence genes
LAKGAIGPSPKSDADAQVALRPLVPEHPLVRVRPMFGSLAAFADTQMFMGVVANELFLRLSEQDRATLMAAGSAQLEPMPGRPMKEYVTVPDWRDRPDYVREWAARSLEYALSLPPKKK